jgi:superfamily II DNA/RNA helicase
LTTLSTCIPRWNPIPEPLGCGRSLRSRGTRPVSCISANSVYTHETSASERRRVLERFRDGTHSRIVAANVLDEGVDVPDAKVAVVLSGSGSEREFTQRLGRVLRAKADGGRAILYEPVTEERGPGGDGAEEPSRRPM